MIHDITFKHLDPTLAPLAFYTVKTAEKSQITNADLHIAFGSVRKKLQLPGVSMVYANQTHSATIALINSKVIPNPIEAVDGLITNIKNLCLCIETADCAPIIMYDPEKKVIAALHAGWKGTAQNIAGKAIESMIKNYRCSSASIHAYIGPCISQKMYEVGFDVYNAFSELNLVMETIFKVANAPHKYFCDIKEANKQLLINEGVFERNIETSDYCTFSNSDKFYSARRDGFDTGRIITGIALTN